MKLFLSTLICILLAYFSNAQAVLVQDIEPGLKSTWIGKKIVFKDKLVFFAETAAVGTELWSYNDTLASLLYDLNPNGGSGSNSMPMAVADGKLYFGAVSDTFGYELHMWDGVNPPSRVADINVGKDGSRVSNIIAYNSKVYFIARSAYLSEELWMYNPTTGQTRKLSNIDPNGQIQSPPNNLVLFDNKIFFGASDLSGPKMYMYDIASDTIGIAPFSDLSDGLSPGNFAICYNKLYYTAYSHTYGAELYVYDGKSIPVRLTDINVGTGSSMYSMGTLDYTPSYIIGYKGSIYFSATPFTPGGTRQDLMLYKYTSGGSTADGTVSLVYDIKDPGTGEFIEFADKLFFVGNDSVHGYELWMYDGVNDPAMFADINPGKAHGSPTYFTIYKNNLYFTASNVTTGTELYRLDKNFLNIENTKWVNDIKVYPVPTSGTINFDIDLIIATDIIISLNDITGKQVYTGGKQSYQTGKATVKANISHLADGNYFYRVTTTDGIMLGSGKIVKQ